MLFRLKMCRSGSMIKYLRVDAIMTSIAELRFLSLRFLANRFLSLRFLDTWENVLVQVQQARQYR